MKKNGLELLHKEDLVSIKGGMSGTEILHHAIRGNAGLLGMCYWGIKWYRWVTEE